MSPPYLEDEADLGFYKPYIFLSNGALNRSFIHTIQNFQRVTLPNWIVCRTQVQKAKILFTLALLKASSDFSSVKVFFFSSTEAVILMVAAEEEEEEEDDGLHRRWDGEKPHLGFWVLVNFDGHESPTPFTAAIVTNSSDSLFWVFLSWCCNGFSSNLLCFLKWPCLVFGLVMKIRKLDREILGKWQFYFIFWQNEVILAHVVERSLGVTSKIITI